MVAEMTSIGGGDGLKHTNRPNTPIRTVLQLIFILS
jgi:hypothetical protein